MKKLAVVTSLLSLLSVWGALLPMRFINHQFPPEKTITSFERFGAKLPSGSEFLLQNLTMGKFYLFALLLSAPIVWLGVRAQKNAKLFAGQAGIVAGWFLVVSVTQLCIILPIFKMGEVVVGGGHLLAKSEFTQIQFLMDSLYPAPQQIFMQRQGEKEVAIPKANGERWVNVRVAKGTNKAFCLVFADTPQQSNATAESFRYLPSRVVELSLPMTNQPLENYSIRTLWTCNPSADMWEPRSIASTWDGKYLIVYSRPYNARTNNASTEATAYIFDVEQSKFLNVPPVAQ